MKAFWTKVGAVLATCVVTSLWWATGVLHPALSIPAVFGSIAHVIV